MSTDKALKLNTSAIFRPEHSMFETQNDLRLEHQAFIFDFGHHSYTTLMYRH